MSYWNVTNDISFHYMQKQQQNNNNDDDDNNNNNKHKKHTQNKTKQTTN